MEKESSVSGSIFKMFLLHCFIVFMSFDIARSFPLQNCSKENKNITVVLDCKGELEEQIHFFQTLRELLNRYTVKSGLISLQFLMMTGKHCSKPSNIDIVKEFHYTESQPIPLVIREISEKLITSYFLNELAFSFIFLYGIEAINSSTNPIINDIVHWENDNSFYDIFYIIQSFELPNYDYSSMDSFYFTSSFKNLNISEFFYQICDTSQEELSPDLTPNMNIYVNSEFQIIKLWRDISSNSAKNYCQSQLRMNLLSLETYDEFVTVMEDLFIFLINYTANNVHLGIHLDSHNEYKWANGSPYLFSDPSRNSAYDKPCFFLDLNFTSIFGLLHSQNLYNLGSYLVEIDCEKPLKQSILVCESENWFSDLYKSQMLSRIYTVKIEVARTQKNIYGFIKEIRGKISNATNTRMHNITKREENKYITVLNKSTWSFFSLAKVDKSMCKSPTKQENECYNKTLDINLNANLSTPCDGEEDNIVFVDTYLSPSVNLNFSLEEVQCESNKSQFSFRCIKDYNNQCEDHSHLLNCENFNCPEPFIKCLNSYCIFPEMFNNSEIDCPHGEEEFLINHWSNPFLCLGDIKRVLKDICFEPLSFIDLDSMNGKNTGFKCNNNNYTCLSSITEYNDESNNSSNLQILEVHEKIYLYKVLEIVISSITTIDISNVWDIVSFQGNKCFFNNFDFEFQYWQFDELIALDISYNNFNHSNYFKSLANLSKLRFLNLSHNDDLLIDKSLNFPRALEVIDLSYTKTKVLRKNVFRDLVKLRHLNLSRTSITHFKDMGIPDYFILDTLYIQFLELQDINLDLFNGLTIKSELVASVFVICCPQIINSNISDKNCLAPIDIIASCKHLVGDTLKRVVIWLVGFSTILGNGMVLVYRIGWSREIFKKAYGLFITGLAISDFIMGVYLMIIAAEDIYFRDVYILEEFKWRNSVLCNLCGLLSTLSSETSTFFICLITLDRFLSVTYPFGEHRFTKIGKFLSFTLVWVIGFVLALIPVVLSGWEIYSSNGLCLALPLSPKRDKGWTYSFVVFVGLNFVLFFTIAIGQLTIFINLIKVKKSCASIRQNAQRRSEDLSVAKKLAFVAFSDFCCWFPVGILGFYSLNGYIFNREVYAWIAVFVLPINSALNPIIYTIPAVYSKCKSLSEGHSITLQTQL